MTEEAVAEETTEEVAEEAVAEGLDVTKAADDSGEFMFRQFRSIVPLN